MQLTRHLRRGEFEWRTDGRPLSDDDSLSHLLSLRADKMMRVLESVSSEVIAESNPVAPIDPYQEVWASGVTYLRSRVERESESTVADVYAKVYEAERPELFFKSLGWRTAGPDSTIRIRRDSSWNVPEPELTLVVNAFAEIVGYTVGNDVSSRSIEGENPLYLPQAKSYDGSCAIGPGIVLMGAEAMKSLNISLNIRRGGSEIFREETSISQMKRQLPELVEFLVRETTFPEGVFLMTGTGIVPSHPFTLEVNDIVQIRIGELLLTNIVSS